MSNFLVGDLGYFAKKAGLLLLRAAFFFVSLLLFTNQAVHLGVKHLIAIGFSQSCSLLPAREGEERMRGCKKKKKKEKN